MATVSIVLCTYNQAHYLDGCLEAFFQQTRPADQIIVLNDGSTDRTTDVLSKWTLREKRLRVVHNGSNRGLMYSINRALRMVDTDYFTWAATDDRILPTFLERSMATLEAHPDAALCFSELSLIKPNGEIFRYAKDAAQAHVFDLQQYPAFMSPLEMRERLKNKIVWMTSNAIVARTRAIMECNGFPPSLEWHSDYFVFAVAALRYGACCVPDMLTLMRANEDGYSGGSMHNPERQIGVLRAMLGILRHPDFANMRADFLKHPVLLSPFGDFMLTTILKSPREWAFFAPYLSFLLKNRFGRSASGVSLWLRHLPFYIRQRGWKEFVFPQRAQ